MSSSGDPRSFAARARQDAAEVAGFLRELERKCGDPARREAFLRSTVANVLTERLNLARRLLGDDHWVMRLVDELATLLVAEQAQFDLVQENAAYVARALEDRYQLGGGGYGIPASQPRSGVRRAITIAVDSSPTSPSRDCPDTR